MYIYIYICTHIERERERKLDKYEMRGRAEVPHVVGPRSLYSALGLRDEDSAFDSRAFVGWICVAFTQRKATCLVTARGRNTPNRPRRYTPRRIDSTPADEDPACADPHSCSIETCLYRFAWARCLLPALLVRRLPRHLLLRARPGGCPEPHVGHG